MVTLAEMGSLLLWYDGSPLQVGNPVSVSQKGMLAVYLYPT